MTSEVVSSITAAVVRLVSESPQQSASGTRVVAAIRSTFPDFSPQAEGFRSFREFIRTFAPQVAESPQRAGMDVIYVLKAPTTSESQPQVVSVESSSKISGFVSLLLNNPRAWKTFASPLSTSRIYVNPDGTSVLVSSPHAPPPSGGWLRIDPISAGSLLAIARDFIDLVPELYRPALNESLTKPKWWIPYFDVMGSLGLKSRWVSFRRRRILDEFMRQVTLRTSEGHAQHTPPSSTTPLPSSAPAQPRDFAPPPTPESGGDGAATSQNRLRAVAVAAISRMSIAELRALVIPLGYIADALEEIR